MLQFGTKSICEFHESFKLKPAWFWKNRKKSSDFASDLKLIFGSKFWKIPIDIGTKSHTVAQIDRNGKLKIHLNLFLLFLLISTVQAVGKLHGRHPIWPERWSWTIVIESEFE